MNSTLPEEWRDLACDWRTHWGRCIEPATHGVFVAGSATPLAARCAKHIEMQRQRTAEEKPGLIIEVRALDAVASMA